MNLSELEMALEELADQLNGDGELSLQIKPILEAGISYGKHTHFCSGGVTEPKDIYWQIAYQLVKYGCIEIEKVR